MHRSSDVGQSNWAAEEVGYQRDGSRHSRVRFGVSVNLFFWSDKLGDHGIGCSCEIV